MALTRSGKQRLLAWLAVSASTCALSAFAEGALIVQSEPPGLYVSIDGGDRVATPASIELRPGTVQSVAPKPEPAHANLDIHLAPPGYAVYVNAEEVGETPLGRLRVKAGPLAVRFERAGEPTRLLYVHAAPDSDSAVSWGLTSVTGVQLPYRTIALDGKPDSWQGIEPIYDGTDDHMVFMDGEASGISRFYLCRDAKNLYWRLDFAEANPFQRIPKGIKEALFAQLTIKIDDERSLNFLLGYFKRFDKTQASWGLWNERTRQSKSLGDIGAFTFKNSRKMLVASIPLNRLEDYCSGTLMVDAQLANFNGTGFEPGTGSPWTPGRYVDFSNAPEASEMPSQRAEPGEAMESGPRLSLYGGLGVAPVGLFATSIMKSGFPGGAMFGATAFFAKVGGASVGIDASYLPIINIGGSSGSMAVSAIPLLFTSRTGNFGAGFGFSILRGSGSLLGPSPQSELDFTTSQFFMHAFATPGMFIGLKTYQFLAFDPVDLLISLGLVVGINL